MVIDEYKVVGIHHNWRMLAVDIDISLKLFLWEVWILHLALTGLREGFFVSFAASQQPHS